MPSAPATSAWPKLTPKLMMKAPYGTASTEMFEAHQGQNSPAAVPLRSDSSMTLMPLASMAPRGRRGLACRGLVDGGHGVPFLTRPVSSGPIRAAVRSATATTSVGSIPAS